MFAFDEEFLEEVGLSGMDAKEKGPFLQHLQVELEMRVGERMGEGLSEAQMMEFEKLAEGDADTVQKVLAEQGDYKVDPVYRAMVERAGMEDGAMETLAEYAAMKWMGKNRPDYQAIVGEVMEGIRVEVERNRERLLQGRA